MKILKIHDLLINPEDTLKEGISKIESGQCKIALVVNKEKQLLGILNDGDVRRALLRNISLNDSVSRAMNTNFIFAENRVWRKV